MELKNFILKMPLANSDHMLNIFSWPGDPIELIHLTFWRQKMGKYFDGETIFLIVLIFWYMFLKKLGLAAVSINDLYFGRSIPSQR